MLVLVNTSTLILSDGERVKVYTVRKHIRQRVGKVELQRVVQAGEPVQIGNGISLTVIGNRTIKLDAGENRTAVSSGDAFFIGLRKASGILSFDLTNMTAKWAPFDPTMVSLNSAPMFLLTFSSLPVSIRAFSSGVFYREASGKMFEVVPFPVRHGWRQLKRRIEVEDALPPSSELTQDAKHRIIIGNDGKWATVVTEAHTGEEKRSEVHIDYLVGLDRKIEELDYIAVMHIPRLSVVFGREDFKRLALCRDSSECSLKGINFWKIDWSAWKRGGLKYVFKYRLVRGECVPIVA